MKSSDDPSDAAQTIQGVVDNVKETKKKKK